MIVSDTEKLLKLADACSDALFGGERGWESMPFESFVMECRVALNERARFKRMIDEGLGWEDIHRDPYDP